MNSSQFIMDTYRRVPLRISRAFGCYICDIENRNFLDTYGGLGVHVLGHNHPELQQLLREKSGSYLHLSNYFESSEAAALAEKLCCETGKNAVYFANSGAEACETAIKIIRKHWGGKRAAMVTIDGNFHGRTMGALSLCTRESIKAPFQPLFPSVVIPIGKKQRLDSFFSKDTAALFIEPLQGEGGVREIPQWMLEELIRLQKKYGFLLVQDEIQSGMFRTGKFLAGNSVSSHADIILLGKGLGGGLPLSACIVNEKPTEVFTPGDHGSTFGGNPLACGLGFKTLEIIRRDRLDDLLVKKGRRFRKKLKDVSARRPDLVKEVRGKGLMLGVDLKDSAAAAKLKDHFFDNRVLVNVTAGTVWRLLPSFLIQDSQLDMICCMFAEFLDQYR
ncbi:MAG: aminotransferase class III-fold pyridoxal phosphate-dependent enzyme [Candidatus Wallbacteria bacterium]|nr:aminotransferase class III-fold pyridoxal phosphate-dependent enzyme [Candidatus Wallbacteria bacterium]